MGGHALIDTRFGLLNSVRAFARERCPRRAWAAAQRRHALHVATWGTPDAVAQLHGHDGAARYCELSVEMGNLRVAFDHAMQLNLIDEACCIAAATYEVCSTRGPFQQGVSMCSRALAHVAITPPWQTQLLLKRGHLQRRLGKLGSARQDVEQALALARERSDAIDEGRALGSLATYDGQAGRTDDAAAGFRRAGILAREVGDRRYEGIWLGNHAVLLLMCGQQDEAHQYLERALAISREAGDQRNESLWLGHLATVAKQRGDLPLARRRLRHALTLARTLGHRQSQGSWLGNLANLSRQAGQFDDARRGYHRATVIARQLGHRLNEGLWLGNLGVLNVLQGRFDDARTTLSAALSIAHEVKDRRRQGLWRGSLATVSVHDGALDAAYDSLMEAQDIARHCSDRRSESAWAARLGWVRSLQSNTVSARAHLDHGLTLATQLRDRWLEGRHRLMYARVTREWGVLHEARDHVARALVLFETIADHVAHTRLQLERCALSAASGELAEARALFETVASRIERYDLAEGAELMVDFRALSDALGVRNSDTI